MTSLFQILMMLLNVAQFFVIAHIIMSWLIQFQVLNLRQPFVSRVWYGLDGLVEPIYRKLRGILPQISGIDLAPLVALIGVFALERLLINNAGLF